MCCWLTPVLSAAAKLPENQAAATGKAEGLQNPALLFWCSLPCESRKKATAWKAFFLTP